MYSIQKVHKRMSTEQLRSVFHVDSQDLVPHYEVIHLTHHGTAKHGISKRSIASSAVASQVINNPHDNTVQSQQKYHSQHVKKDLSKSAYYSNSKITSSTSKSSFVSIKPLNITSTNNLSSASVQTNNNYENSLINFIQTNVGELGRQNEMPSRQLPTIKSSDEDMGDYIAIKTSDDNITNQTTTKSFEHIDLSNIKEHNVSLIAFGDVFNLTLRPNEQLFKNGLQSLKMFAVNTNPNSTHGLDYEPIEEVSQKNNIFISVI